ncbi:AfsA-related hotdog domain-containing protein [Archangium lansingense]|uniref:AfsA-related hotdog domain-containing protein n=1 Tax=Archangium lansingense TaxID=2995310 RepID=A0ABT4ABD2_9BACT|nr:AfsA-related hotdog domain-containing protein [Archangium lansinium]MCY1078881.1 AfsA-related hotdog domain-containing protein [Archangium lansinium]
MRTKVLHVVGERFAGFSHENPEEVVTLSQLERMLGNGTLQGDVTLLIGQGIPDEGLRRLREQTRHAPHGKRVTLEPGPSALERASSRLAHKHLEQNIMITLPETMVEGERYVSSLLLDDRCAELSDHMTGQHIQGMVLIEAARQMMLAVTERYFLKDRDRSHYFVINQIDATYHAFGFPLGMDVEYHILEHKEGKRGSLSSEVKVCFVQGGELLTEVKIRFTVYDAAFLSQREAEKARQAIARGTPAQSLPKAG